jgi:DNA-binding winged helix-turn-helix (wHTH) protein
MDTPARLLRFDAYEVDTVHRQLRCDGQPLPLTSKAFDLLCVLIERRHEVVPKNVLMDEVWPGRVVEENNLCQAVAALRRALGTDAHDHRFILTVPRRGYRFVGDVQPGAPRARRRSDRDPAVFDAVAADRALLRARFRLHHRDLSAPRAFLDAIRLDPANADAYAGLAQA